MQLNVTADYNILLLDKNYASEHPLSPNGTNFPMLPKAVPLKHTKKKILLRTPKPHKK